jgi:uncharacterized cupin superfamily protein
MKCVFNLFNESAIEFTRWSHGEHFGGKEAELGNAFKAEVLGFHVEVLDPGKFSCPYHRHEKEEELFLVIKGSATVRQNDEFFQVREGDLVFFKREVAHHFYNHTEEPFLFFALSSTHPEEVCEYPDSRKKLEVSGRKLTQDGNPVEDYWKDEDDPGRFWPESIIKSKG